MTESQWLISADPQEMLRAIDPTLTRKWKHGDPEPWRVWSTRKVRLFACACLRSLPDEVKGGLEELPLRTCAAAERYADGEPKDEDYREGEVWQEYVCHPSAKIAAERFIETGYAHCKPLLANLLRDIFGNPYRKLEHHWRDARCSKCSMLASTHKNLITSSHSKAVLMGSSCSGVDKSWLTWCDGLIPHMAQGIYDNRRFDDLPILADALEEAGCQDEDILKHCRGYALGLTCVDPEVDAWDLDWVKSKTPHVRGCWVVDLLLGKE